MPELWAFLEQNIHLEQSEMVRRFIAQIIEPNRDKYLIFYAYMNEEITGIYLNKLLNNLVKLKEICFNPDTGRIYNLALEIIYTYPDFPKETKVYLMPSFGDIFKCMAFPLAHENVLRIGPDELMHYPETAFRIVVQRELMHIYHYHINPDYRLQALRFLVKNELPLLYQLIWSECLATFAVKKLNPDYSYDDLLNCTGLVENINLARSDIAKMLDYNLETTNISGFFFFPSSNYPGLPVGCGNYLGLLILEDIATRFSIQEMFTFTDDVILPEIKTSLAKLTIKDPGIEITDTTLMEELKKHNKD
jgi:hypothetical protein